MSVQVSSLRCSPRAALCRRCQRGARSARACTRCAAPVRPIMHYSQLTHSYTMSHSRHRAVLHPCD
eukprot:scaffold27403_cov110-Isochrysis_galbana.AAC.2